MCIGFYFDKYRPFATGVSLSGSGVGVFFFRPMIVYFFMQVPINKQENWRQFMEYEAFLLLTTFILIFFFVAPRAVKFYHVDHQPKCVQFESSSSEEESDQEVKIHFFSQSFANLLNISASLRRKTYQSIDVEVKAKLIQFFLLNFQK